MKIQTLKSQESSESHITCHRSDDGTVLFNLLKVESGVYVERVQKRLGVFQVRQASRFQNEEDFLFWLESDPLQFVHPLLFTQIKRTVYELFDKVSEFG